VQRFAVVNIVSGWSFRSSSRFKRDDVRRRRENGDSAGCFAGSCLVTRSCFIYTRGCRTWVEALPYVDVVVEGNGGWCWGTGLGLPSRQPVLKRYRDRMGERLVYQVLQTLRKSVLGKFPFFFHCLPKILHTAQQDILKTPCGVEDNMETPACAWVFLPEIADSRSSSRREQRVVQWGPTRLGEIVSKNLRRMAGREFWRLHPFGGNDIYNLCGLLELKT
jgi:hypothetical protein